MLEPIKPTIVARLRRTRCSSRRSPSPGMIHHLSSHFAQISQNDYIISLLFPLPASVHPIKMTIKSFLVQLLKCFGLHCCLATWGYCIFAQASDQGFEDAVVDPDVLDNRLDRIRKVYALRHWMKASKAKCPPSQTPPFNTRTRTPLHSRASSRFAGSRASC